MTQEHSELKQFSLYIDKASFHKESGEMRFHAVGSDTLLDSYGDNMTAELFSDFLQRIESKESPPEGYGNDFWNGGIPYLSVSHYPDHNGDAVPGEIQEVYMDGNRLKGNCRFYETSLGMAAFKSVCKDQTDGVDEDEKIRISIAFLDYKHKHRASGFTFERKSIDDICPECIKEFMEQSGEGKEYLRGHLVHWALTRKPVNQRTDVELEEKSMSDIVTQKDDAASIVGEEEAAKIDEMKAVAKSEAIVVKAEEEVEVEPEVEEVAEPEEEDRLDKVLSLLEKEKDELDLAYDQFRSDLANAKTLEDVQPAFETFGNVIRGMYETPEVVSKDEVSTSQLNKVMETLTVLTEKVDLLSKSRTEPVVPTVPEKRSITLDPNAVLSQPRKPRTIREISRESVGLDS